jgi:beta-lactamase class D
MPSHPAFLSSRWIACFMAFCLFQPLPAAAETRVIEAHRYDDALSGLAVSFLARDLATGTDYVLEGSSLDCRHTPLSTFKIANLVIALETGAAASLDDWRPWIPQERPAEPHWPEAWRQGQTLEQAFRRSAVWYFRDLARKIGSDTYRAKLSAWGYGNAAAPAGSDDFWLDNTLRVSVGEQVGFLEKLVAGRLDVRPQNISALDRASLSGTEGKVAIHGKTGAGPDDPSNADGAFSGWYVGYLRRQSGEPVVFALHVTGPSFRTIAGFRRAFALRLLTDIGLVSSVSGQ